MDVKSIATGVVGMVVVLAVRGEAAPVQDSACVCGSSTAEAAAPTSTSSSGCRMGGWVFFLLLLWKEPIIVLKVAALQRAAGLRVRP